MKSIRNQIGVMKMKVKNIRIWSCGLFLIGLCIAGIISTEMTNKGSEKDLELPIESEIISDGPSDVLVPRISGGDPTNFRSTSHTQGAYSTLQDFDLAWDNASGINSFRLMFDSSPTTDVTEEIGEYMENGLTHGFYLPTSGAYYFHIKSVEYGDPNVWGNTVHTGPYYIDLDAPVLPSVVSSPTHSNTTWSNDGDINVSWAVPSDAAGVQGYNHTLSTSLAENIGESVYNNLTEAEYTASVSGKYYFHLKAVDNIDNWNGATKRYGYEFWIDFDEPDTSFSNFVKDWDTSTWNDSSDISVSWSSCSDTGGSGIDGYAIKWSQLENDLPSASKTNEETELSDDHTFSGDGVWWFHIRAVDNAGNWDAAEKKLGPFWVDTTEPTNPTFDVVTLDDTWDPFGGDYLFINWTGAADSGSGVKGYHYAVNTDPNYTPIIGTDYYTTNEWAESYSNLDGKWYFHLITVDDLDQLASSAIHHEFWVDIHGPGAISSPIANESTSDWTENNTIEVSWTAAVDYGGIGTIGGYSICWTNSPTTIPNQTVHYNTTSLSNISQPLDDGVWYLHIQPFDSLNLSANTANVSHIGPFWIDITSPSNPAYDFNSPSLDAWTDTSTIQVQWDLTADDGDGSGIAGYCLVLSQSISDPTEYVMNFTSRSHSFTTVPSGKYYVHLCTIDEYGYWAWDWVTIGEFWVDSDAPGSPAFDGGSSDPTTGSWTEQSWLYQEWFASSAGTGSDIAGYCLILDSSASDPGGSPVNNKTLLNHNYSISLTGSYYLHLAVVDDVGHWSSWTALGIFQYDLSNPVFSDLTSGQFNATIDLPSNQDYISADWLSFATDGLGSGINGYAWMWDFSNDTDPDGVTDWEGSGTSGELNFLGSNTAIYFHIKAKDNVNRWSNTVHYGPFFIDHEAPNNPETFNAPSHAIGPWSITTLFAVTWTNSSDNLCQIDQSTYAWIVDTSPTWLSPNISANQQYSNNIANYNLLSSSDSFYFHIIMRDRAGNWNMSATTYGPFKYDHDYPICPTTLLYTNATGGWMDTTQIDIRWDTGSDVGSGISRYLYLWSTNPAADPTVSSFSTTNTYLNATFGTLGQYFNQGINYLIICVEDGAGRKSAAVFNMGRSFQVDITAPTYPVNYELHFNVSYGGDLWDQSVWDVNCSGSSYFWVNWSVATLDPGFGIAGYSIRINTNPSPSPSTNVNYTNTSVYLGPFADGETWYIHLNLVDEIGKTTGAVITYGPLKIDTVKPGDCGYGSATPNPNNWIISSPAQITINTVTNPDVGSGVVGFSYTWGTNPNNLSDTIIDCTEISSNLTFTGLSTTGIFYFILRSVDKAGNWGDATIIATYKLDFTPPNAPTGINLNIPLDTWTNVNDVDVVIVGTIDPAGIEQIYGYHIYISTQANLTGYNPGTIANYTTASFTVSDICDGTYYIYVWCFDGNSTFGKFHISTSNFSVGPIKIDTAIPIKPTAINANCTVGSWNKQTNIAVNWTGQSDALSGILGYCVVLSTSESFSLSVGSRVINASSPAAIFTNISDGKYYVYVYIIDIAGNWATLSVKSAHYWFDGQPPVTAISIAGTLNSETLYYSTSVTITLSAAFGDLIYYSIDSGTVNNVVAPIVISKEGKTLLKYYSVDVAGNIESEHSLVFWIDLANPNFSSNMITFGNSTQYLPGSIIPISIDLTSETNVAYIVMQIFSSDTPQASTTLKNTINITTKDSNGKFIYNLDSKGLAVGQYTINFRAVESSGRSKEIRGAITFTLTNQLTTSATTTPPAENPFEDMPTYYWFIIIGVIVGMAGVVALSKRKPKEKTRTAQLAKGKKKKRNKSKKYSFQPLDASKIKLPTKEPAQEEKFAVKEESKPPIIPPKKESKLKNIGSKTVKSAPQQPKQQAPPQSAPHQPTRRVPQQSSQPAPQQPKQPTPQMPDHTAPVPSSPSHPQTPVKEDLTIYCSKCKYAANVPEDRFSKQLEVCPNCANQMVLVYQCPHCNQYFSIPYDQYLSSQDKVIRCLNCSHTLKPAKIQ
jgi:hypothetical protein